MVPKLFCWSVWASKKARNVPLRIARLRWGWFGRPCATLFGAAAATLMAVAPSPANAQETVSATDRTSATDGTVFVGGSGLPAVEVDVTALAPAEATPGRPRIRVQTLPSGGPRYPEVAPQPRPQPGAAKRRPPTTRTPTTDSPAPPAEEKSATPEATPARPPVPRVPAVLFPAEVASGEMAPEPRRTAAAVVAPAVQPAPEAQAPAAPKPVVATAALSPPPAVTPATTKRAAPPPAPRPKIVRAPLVAAPTPKPVAPPPPPSVTPPAAKSPPPSAPVAVAARTPSAQLIPDRVALQVTFSGAETDISVAAKNNLTDLAGRMGADSGRLQLKAFAGTSGGAVSATRRLSLQRALAVRTFLIERGVKSTRIDVRALGAANDDGPQERVDVVYLSK